MLTGVTGLFCVDRCYRTVLCCQVLQDCSVLTGVTGLFYVDRCYRTVLC